MSEEVSGPIMDAIREAIAKKLVEIINDPQKLVALITMLINLFPKEGDGVFSANDPDIAELASLLEQAAAWQS